MLFSELQDIVEHVSAEFGVAAVLEDAQLQIIAYSSVPEDGLIDRLRRESIIHRKAPAGVEQWLRACGIYRADGPMWIPPSAEHGTLGRLCCPVRYYGQLLGFLWLIDDQREIYDGSCAQAARHSDQLALLLYERHLSHRLHAEVVTHLLSDIPALRTAAATTIADNDLWRRGARACAVVVSVAGRRPADLSEQAHRLAAEAIARTLERTSGAPGSLRATFGEHAVLLEPCWPEDDGPVRTATAAAATLAGLLGRHAELDGLRPAVGVGDPKLELVDAHDSYRTARLATTVSGLVESVGPVACWRELGVYRTLVQLPLSEPDRLGPDPRVLTLFRDADLDLLTTLETYLDLGGDVHRTAAQLHTHRGTVYNRLDKIERLTDLHLHDGNDRLCAHLGFKLARLTHSYPL